MSQQSLFQFLIASGFDARVNPHGHIAFTYEAFTYLLCFDSKDPEFALLLLPKVWQVSVCPLVLDVLNSIDAVNRKFKVVKGYTQRDQVSFSVEIWLQDPADWSFYLQRALRSLDSARVYFGEHIATCMVVQALPASTTIQ